MDAPFGPLAPSGSIFSMSYAQVQLQTEKGSNSCITVANTGQLLQEGAIGSSCKQFTMSGVMLQVGGRCVDMAVYPTQGG